MPTAPAVLGGARRAEVNAFSSPTTSLAAELGNGDQRYGALRKIARRGLVCEAAPAVIRRPPWVY